ncbi:Male sterility [Macleaya cordata]|uniref:Fatty acyl-CoA reductase n=1 Tax=Macleaya cordata TaxID=56857 RepID=A0A200PZF0_MACCD|nr:Male sterility [Macleaya cordata]
MELNGSIVESLENKSILVTGSTGFLAKIFVEKVLRVQPNVKRFYLLLRATDAASATHRLHNEVIGKEVFRVMKEKYCERFNSFISEKVTLVAGDAACVNLGIQDFDLREKIWREVDVVANFAATTNFYDRYDVALGTNTLGAKYVFDFAKKCEKLEMLLHVSTAYVCGEKAGLILEKPLKMGETLNGTSSGLDIEVELKLVEERLNELKAKQVSKKQETEAMKELGLQRARLFGWPNTYVFTKAMGEMVIGHLRGNLPLVILRPTIVTSTYKEPFPGWIEGVRTVDSFIVGCGNGKLKCFLGNPETIMDVIPGDMVVNAAIVTMVIHANQPSQFIYQVGSSKRAPMNSVKLRDYAYHYFSKNPLMSKDGKLVKVAKPVLFPTMTSFRRYLDVNYMVPLKGLQLVNAIFCQYFGDICSDMERKINFVIRLVELYEPYILFKGKFDDLNSEKLRVEVKKANEAEANTFYFDPKCIHWDDYFMNIHIPGLVKYVIN